MAIHGERDLELGADAVRAGHKHWLAQFFDIQREQSAEPAHLAQHFGAAGGSEQSRQGSFDPVAQVNIDSRRRVGFLTHACARYPPCAVVTSSQADARSGKPCHPWFNPKREPRMARITKMRKSFSYAALFNAVILDHH